MKATAALITLLTAGLLTACGGGEPASDASTNSEPKAAAAADLGAVKGYLLDHTTRLKAEVGRIRQDAEAYYALAKEHDLDAAVMLREDRAEVARLVKSLQDGFTAANPAYEEMEGVVAGVPSLAEFDVSIDAGGDRSDPENAVSFSIETPGGKTLEQPGNFNYLIETAVYGTDERWAAEAVKPDLDGDGKVEFGEAVPDPDILVGTARAFSEEVDALDAAAREYEPTVQDTMTALVVMTPTMSEYFEAWKSSRFVAGDKATEKAFVAASRLQDISDILGGLVLIYESVEPAVAEADAQQAKQTGTQLVRLRDFASRVREAEARGQKFTAADADTLGGQAQDRAEAIAGQVSQAAKRLGVELES